MKKWVILGGTLLAVFGTIYGIYAYQMFKQISMMKNMQPPPQAVRVVAAKIISWQPQVTSNGALEAKRSVNLAAQNAGIVTQLPMQDGAEVKAGALLAVLDHEALAAEVKNDRAQLALAKDEAARYKKLIAKKWVSAQLMENKQAAWSAAEAKWKASKVALEERFIRAPFACRLGMAQVDVGQRVDAGQTIVDCYDLEALQVKYALPQQYIPALKLGQTVHLKVDAYPSQVFDAKLITIDAKVSDTTRSVQVEAQVNNAHHRLLPGMLVTVQTPVGFMQKVVVVPQTAIHATLYGNDVFVLNADAKPAKVKQVRVQLGEAVGTQAVVVLSGLKAGEQVVSLGQDQLRDGASVHVQSETPKASELAHDQDASAQPSVAHDEYH